VASGSWERQLGRAGLPATAVPAGTSWRTMLPAATIASWPIVTPGRISERAPTNTRRPILTGATRVYPRWRFVLASWARIITPRLMIESSPIEISHAKSGSMNSPPPVM
jgi:hypothetical protein